ncbi:MAG TPA: peptidase S8, partial [Micromonosporaceae bacterium]|nr:peptidase S8 [Micromonosporaceae bacterium]
MDQPERSGGAIEVVLAALAGVWIAAVTFGTQAVTWLVQQVLEVSGRPLPGWVWPAVGWFAAGLAGVPAVLLALLPRSPAVRAAGRAWLIAAIALGVLGSIRALPSQHHELYLGLLAFAAAGLAAGVVAVRRRGLRPLPAPGGAANPAGVPRPP